MGTSQVVLVVKNTPANAEDTRDGREFDSWFGKIPWRRKWQSTPALLPGEFHGQRSLAGYSPRGRKELDTTEQLTLSLSSFRQSVLDLKGAGSNVPLKPGRCF